MRFMLLLLMLALPCCLGCSSEPERIHTKKYYFHESRLPRTRDVTCIAPTTSPAPKVALQ